MALEWMGATMAMASVVKNKAAARWRNGSLVFSGGALRRYSTA